MVSWSQSDVGGGMDSVRSWALRPGAGVERSATASVRGGEPHGAFWRRWAATGQRGGAPARGGFLSLAFERKVS